MVTFLSIAFTLWLFSVVVWLAVSRAMRSADVERIKSRLIGTKPKAEKTQAKAVPLFQPPDTTTGPVVRKILGRYHLNEKLQELLEQAGLKWNVARLVHACLGMFLAGFWLSWFMLPDEYRAVSYIPALGGAVLPLLYVLRKRTTRLRQFESQFPESLEFVARSMRAGHAFSVSLEMIHREFADPLAAEFRRTFEEHNLGLPLDVALEKLAKRVPSMDVHFFVAAVLMQKRTGGNLAEILDKLAYVIRERFKLRGRIRAISAHGKMTGAALSTIPLGVAVLMFYVNPDYVRFFFTDETGNIMMGAAIGLQLLGYAIIKKIVSIEV